MLVYLVIIVRDSASAFGINVKSPILQVETGCKERHTGWLKQQFISHVYTFLNKIYVSIQRNRISKLKHN